MNFSRGVKKLDITKKSQWAGLSVQRYSCFFSYFDHNKVCLIVPESECPSHDPECNRVVKRGSALDGDLRAGDEPHFPEALTEDATDLD
jgi:hypothetical protein